MDVVPIDQGLASTSMRSPLETWRALSGEVAVQCVLALASAVMTKRPRLAEARIGFPDVLAVFHRNDAEFPQIVAADTRHAGISEGTVRARASGLDGIPHLAV